MPSDHIRTLIAHLPERPGVYIMLDAQDAIIYVGKSVNLRARVRSYFAVGAALNFAKIKMVEKVENIRYIETASEVEALVLETTLIKKHLPKYNVLLKDDKNLSYIALRQDEVGEVYRTRIRPTATHTAVFGPFPSGTHVFEGLTELRRVFRVRSCRMKFSSVGGTIHITDRAGRSVPCLDHYIGLCPAPCLLTQGTLAEHAENIQSLKSFLRGERGGVIETFRTRMREHAERQEFEAAARMRDRIKDLEHLAQRQVARDAIAGDTDIIAFHEQNNKRFVALVEVRGGSVTSVRQWILESALDEEKTDIFAAFLMQHYNQDSLKRDIITTSCIRSDVQAWLTESGCTIRQDPTGPRRELLSMAEGNVLAFAHRTFLEGLTSKTLTRAAMASVMAELGFTPPKSWPISFECYDISHTSGRFTVASRSVVVNGRAETNLYRKYRIKTLEDGQIDDFASLREILSRRAQEASRENNWPTMVLIDGGLGQLSSAREGIEAGLKLAAEAGITPILCPALASLAKREETLFTEDNHTGVRFAEGSQELRVVQLARDEAHRFAIGYNRSKRTTEMKRNILEELPGFGPKTRQKLLKAFGTIEAISHTPKEELKKYLSKIQIETLESHGLLQQ